MKKTLFTIGVALLFGFGAMAQNLVSPTAMTMTNAYLSAGLAQAKGPLSAWSIASIAVGEVYKVTVTATNASAYDLTALEFAIIDDDASVGYWKELSAFVSIEKSFAAGGAISETALLTIGTAATGVSTRAKLVVNGKSTNPAFTNQTDNPAVTATVNFADVTITIENLACSIQVSKSGNGSGVVSQNTNYANKGEEITITAEAGENSKFIGWQENGEIVSTNAEYTFEVTGNRNLVAVFEKLPYIALSSSIYGGTMGGSGYYEKGEHVTETAATSISAQNPWYEFIGWQENGVIISTDINYSFVVTNDRELIAIFQLLPFISTQTSPLNIGSISRNNDGHQFWNNLYYEKGFILTLTATETIDSKFTGWQENGVTVSTDAEYSFEVTKDRSLVAVFEILDPKITVSAIPANAGTVAGNGTYLRGEIAEATATAKTGYEFVNWQENGVVVSHNARYLFTVAQSRNLIATFRETETDISDITIPAEKGIAIVPENESARVAWNAVENATGYTLVINNSNNELVCSLEFDANGRLESLTFGAGLKTQENVFGVRVTNLSENTTYNYKMEVIGENSEVINTKTGTFTTKGGSVGIVETHCNASLPSVVGYYSLTGAKLAQEPKQGTYIIMYDNGTSEKRVK